MADEQTRNPLFVPEPTQKRPCCPKCGDTENFSGRRIQGVVTFSCTKCGAKWGGGLAREPQDPRLPHPADPNPPNIDFIASPKSPTGVEELRRRVDLRPDFRKGAQVDDGDD